MADATCEFGVGKSTGPSPFDYGTTTLLFLERKASSFGRYSFFSLPSLCVEPQLKQEHRTGAAGC